ncbi:MAG: Rieske 2Fe-2S domain-containing protein, partial [Actinomycetes bacterium]
VEDRCRHRRVPLSRGWVTEDGALQCPYHGWCYEGAEGRLVRVPNYRPDQRVPQVRLITYATRESHGFVYLRAGGGTGASTAPTDPPLAVAVSRVTGSVELPMQHTDVVAAVLVDPLAAVGGAGAVTSVGSVEVDEVARGCRAVRTTRKVRRGRSALAPLLLGMFGGCFRVRTESWPITGLTTLTVSADGPRVLQAVLAPQPLTADRTMLRWRLTCHGDLLVAARERALAAAGAVLHRRVMTALPSVATSVAREGHSFNIWAALTQTPDQAPREPSLPAAALPDQLPVGGNQL